MKFKIFTKQIKTISQNNFPHTSESEEYNNIPILDNKDSPRAQILEKFKREFLVKPSNSKRPIILNDNNSKCNIILMLNLSKKEYKTNIQHYHCTVLLTDRLPKFNERFVLRSIYYEGIKSITIVHVTEHVSVPFVEFFEQPEELVTERRVVKGYKTYTP